MNSNKITACELIVKRLEQHGINEAFGVVGGAIMYITEALRKSKHIRSTFVHHEQSAAIAAESYGKLCNRPAMIFATAGPGVTNTLTGIADAYMDSVPMIVLIGDVRSTISADFKKQRYNAPQEVNQGALLKPLVKHYTYLKPSLEGYQILEEIDKAFKCAISDRMGPVCISIPLDMQGRMCDATLLNSIYYYDNIKSNNTEYSTILKRAFMHSKRPIVLLGSGVRMSGAMEKVMLMVHKLELPYCVSIGAVDLQNVDDPLSCGCVGPVSQRAANLLLHSSDLILALGTSFDQSVTGFNVEDLIKNKKVLLVNIDPGEFLRFKCQSIIPIVADVKDFCTQINDIELEMPGHRIWLSKCMKIKNLLNFEAEASLRTTARENYLSAYDVTKSISENISINSTIVLGISLDAVSVFNAFSVKGNQRVIISRNLGPMGWDIPALLGAAIAISGEVILITGDGSFMVNIQELAVIVAKQIPACIFVFNNDGYASIRTTQANFFGTNYFGCDSDSGLPIPALSGLAKAFGLEYNKLTELTSIKDLMIMHARENKPRIIECMIDPQQLREPRLVTRMENGNFITPLICDMTPPLTQENLKVIDNILSGILDD
jgi:acetolactate synthase-1/2/3 large subunit